jgi:hypothetical protein
MAWPLPVPDRLTDDLLGAESPSEDFAQLIAALRSAEARVSRLPVWPTVRVPDRPTDDLLGGEASSEDSARRSFDTAQRILWLNRLETRLSWVPIWETVRGDIAPSGWTEEVFTGTAEPLDTLNESFSTEPPLPKESLCDCVGRPNCLRSMASSRESGKDAVVGDGPATGQKGRRSGISASPG